MWRILLLTLTGFNALSAAAGFWYLAPGGAPGWPLDFLAGGPFDSYFWPGVILLVAVGGTHLVAFVLLARRSAAAPFATAVAAFALSIWIIAEMLLFTVPDLGGGWILLPILQVVYFTLSLAELGCLVGLLGVFDRERAAFRLGRPRASVLGGGRVISPWRTVLVVLTAFNVVSAMLGFIVLVPLGGAGLPTTLLNQDVFTTFLWPGIILLVVVGGTHALALWQLISRHWTAALASTVAGFGMLLWVIAELFLFEGHIWAQPAYFAVGLGEVGCVLALLGLFEARRTRAALRAPERSGAPLA